MIWSGSLFSKMILIGSGSLFSKTIVIGSGSISRGPSASLQPVMSEIFYFLLDILTNNLLFSDIPSFFLKITSCRWLKENNRLLFPITGIDNLYFCSLCWGPPYSNQFFDFRIWILDISSFSLRELCWFDTQN